jgi:hypothetical protein
MSENVIYVYTGQPFIGEAVIHLLMAFNSEPYDGGCSPHEREHSQIALALIMIALESIVKVRLDTKGIKEPRELEKLFEETVDGFTREHGGLELWTELKILRNQVIHSAYFQRNAKGGYTSRATENKLQAPHYMPYIDRDEECTKRWQLSINPLNLTRYEAFIAFLFFYWYGKATGAWKSNNPLDTPEVDCRMKHNIQWITRDDYSLLVGHGNDFSPLIGCFSGRLSKKHRDISFRLAEEALELDLNSSLRVANGILSMSRNQWPDLSEI